MGGSGLFPQSALLHGVRTISQPSLARPAKLQPLLAMENTIAFLQVRQRHFRRRSFAARGVRHSARQVLDGLNGGWTSAAHVGWFGGGSLTFYN
jgi:hypothetical protein